MANIKITDLTAYTAPETTDVMPIVDVTTDTTKKVAVGEVVGKITGDVDVATDGTSSITAGAIVDADVNASAGIGLGKLATGALPTGITVTSANIVDGTIVDADISASAAINGTKIDPDFGSQTIETTGVINAGSGTAAEPSVSVGTTDNGLYSPNADQVALSTNGIGRLFVDASGNVSIGFSSSTTALNVTKTSSGTDSNTLLVQNKADAVGTAASIYLSTNTAGTGIERSAVIKGISGSGTATELALFTNASGASPTERLRITSTGLVGIGTSSPSEKLEVVGTIKATDINFTGLATYADNAAAITGGLVAGDVYRKSDGTLMITY